MSVIYQIAEFLATIIEGLLLFYVSENMCKQRFDKKKNMFIVAANTIVYTAIITIMNNHVNFSFVTLISAILLTFIGLSILSNDRFVNRFTATMLVWFFISALDYVLSYSMIMIIGRSTDISAGIPLILNPGKTRLLFLTIVKGLQLIFFISCKKLYPKLQLLKGSSIWFFCIITTLSYIVISILTQMIVTDSLVTLQTAVIFSLIFIILTIVCTIFAVTLNSKYQNEKREMQIMALSNQMMEKNFTDLQNSQNIINKQVHDFKNHLRTINGIVEDESPAKEYINDLLKESYNSAKYCRSGNTIIDSIINYKMSQAESESIRFSYNVILVDQINIAYSDICAILANQLDNAIEACLKIKDNKKRYIKVDIHQKQNFTFFKVTNSCEKNPFDSNNELHTHKNKNSEMHGFGVKNIESTSEKYNGILKSEYKNGEFVSIAMITNNV